MVTLTESGEVFPLFQHPGTELLFMLEGVVVYGHGDARYRLHPGDALQFDGEGAHGPDELVSCRPASCRSRRTATIPRPDGPAWDMTGA